MTYYDRDHHHETDAERSDREHDERLAREDRRREYGPLPDKERIITTGRRGAVSAIEVQHISGDAAAFLGMEPCGIAEHPDAQARVDALRGQYASVEVDRLPPMGALHWLVRAEKADGSVDVFRVGSHGSLMPWGAR